jgi:hypothetical protein
LSLYNSAKSDTGNFSSTTTYINNHVSFGCIISIPIPIAAAIGSCMVCFFTIYALARFFCSTHFHLSNSGWYTYYHAKLSKHSFFLMQVCFFINILIIFSEDQNQQLHHLQRSYCLNVFAFYLASYWPLYQQQWFSRNSIACLLSKGCQQFYHYVIKVFAVPRSIAISLS